MSSSSPTRFLRKCRFRWYKEQIFNDLIRFKHIVIIFLVFFISDYSLILKICIDPILAILDPSSSLLIFEKIIIIFIIFAIYLIWVLLQKNAILGGSSRQYLITLPISKIEWFISDCQLILIANNILWIPLLALGYSIVVKFSWNGGLLIYCFERWILLIISILALQLFCIQKQTNLTSKKILPSVNFVPHMFSKLKIYYAILFRQYFLNTIIRFCLIIIISLLAYKMATLTSLGFYNVTILYSAILMFLVSEFYPKLIIEHAKCKEYLDCFARSELFWVWADFMFLSTIIFCLEHFLLLPWVYQGKLSYLQYFTLNLYQIPVLIALYVSQSRFAKQGTFISVCIVGLWLCLIFYFKL